MCTRPVRYSLNFLTHATASLSWAQGTEAKEADRVPALGNLMVGGETNP